MRYVNLPDGNYLYSSWWPNFLLVAAQELPTAFDLEDAVRVRLAQPADIAAR